MSDRDLELLEAANLSIAEAATVIGRSRQALYAGLKKTEDYLSTSDMIILMLDAKRKDAPYLAHLVEFIDARYDASNSAIDKSLLFPGRVGTQQLLLACSYARTIFMLLNENEAHLNSNSVLMTSLVEISKSSTIPKIEFIVPTPKIGMRLNELLTIPTGRLFFYHLNVADIPTMIISKQGSLRAFGFTRMSLDEFDTEDAKALWEMANSRHLRFSRNPQF